MPSWSRAVAPRVVPLDPEKLREILRQLGEPPEEIDNATGVQDELRRLAEFTSPAFLNAWVDMPKDSQRALVGMCVARARHVQDEIKAELHPATIEAELDRFFSGMTAFSKREQPGFVDQDGIVGPPDDACLRELVRRSAQVMGVGTTGDIADVHRLPNKAVDAHAADAGLLRVTVEGWRQPAWATAEALAWLGASPRARSSSRYRA